MLFQQLHKSLFLFAAFSFVIIAYGDVIEIDVNDFNEADGVDPQTSDGTSGNLKPLESASVFNSLDSDKFGARNAPAASSILTQTNATDDEEECLPKLDLIFLLDTSGSIEEIYQEHVRWAVALVDSLQIEPDAVRVASIQYAGFPLTEFALGTYPSVEDIRQHLKQMSFQSGVTRTGYALRKAEAELFREDRGARKDALKLIILFTDGLSIDDPLKPAAQLRDLKGVKIYVVSVGNDGFESEMSRIAGDKKNVFGPDELQRLRNSVLNDAERARACSQIGPTWLRHQDSTKLKTPVDILNRGILPPLDFLELTEDSSEAGKELNATEVKRVEGDVKPEIEFLNDSDKSPGVASAKILPPTNLNTDTDAAANPVEYEGEEPEEEDEEEEEEEDVDIVADILGVFANASNFEHNEDENGDLKAGQDDRVETTPLPAKQEVSKLAVSAARPAAAAAPERAGVPSTPTTTAAVPTTESPIQKLEKDAQKASQTIKKVKIPQRAFAVPTLTESEDVKDVFDMDEKDRKLFKSTSIEPKSTRATAKPFTTRRATTARPTTTTVKKLTTTTTTKRPTTTRASRLTTKRAGQSTAAAASTTQRPLTTSTRRLTTRRIFTTTTRPRPTTPFRFATSNCAMDILFIVDSSGSVQQIYDEQKDYLKSILENVNLEDNKHRVSLLQFAGSSIQKTEWSFDSFSNSSDLMKGLNNVRLITGTTYIGAALESSLQVLESRRRNVPTVVVLLSDGFSQDDATVPAEMVKKLHNVEFYSVSISQLTNKGYLAQLVGNPDHVFVDSGAQQFKNVLTKKINCK